MGEVREWVIQHNLRGLRESQGFTQASLAMQMCVSRSYLCLVEKKERSGSIHFWCKAGKVLGVSLNDLLGDNLEPIIL